ncbi:hypothetical protein Tco_0907735 [Tanacetum coccineum]|uniref:Retroviral polymerase SH3-like domain-containing protein n=1 Tax=Tanacetum coccineum TaxID=301880 RepID=A0ABQ5CLA0_9ASTR
MGHRLRGEVLFKFNVWVPIGKCNWVLERQKKPRNQIFRALTASAHVPSSVTETTDTRSTLPPPPPPLQKPTCHRDIWEKVKDQKSRMHHYYKDGKVRSKCENKGIVPTEMELVLEYTQQGASHEVSDHLKMEMEMEIPSSSNVKLITECSDTTYTCYEVMKDLIKVSKLPQTLISYSSSQVLGCETLVKCDTPEKLQQGYVKCIFVGYPKETMGYYFYIPPENKIVVARYDEFFKKNLITQEASGRALELEEIQEEDTSHSENTSEHHVEAESLEPQIDVALVRKSERTHRAPDRLCLNVEGEEHSLGDLNDHVNYKAALLDLEYDKWLDAMNAEMKFMKDNKV